MNLTEHSPYTRAADAARALRAATGIDQVDLAVTLGSGWSGAAELIGEELASIPADQIPGFSAPAVQGHVGTLRFLRTESGHTVLVLGARTHLYEGKGVEATVHPVRTAAQLGARQLILTNGCGGLNQAWGPGTPVIIKDHINFTGTSPVTGATFIDQTHVYSPRLRQIAQRVDPSLDEGVYMQFRGPFYESPAEVRMAGILGADLVGMSTVLEAMAAREAELEVLGLSLVTNLAAGISPTALSHQEVIDAGRAAAPRIATLLATVVKDALKENNK